MNYCSDIRAPKNRKFQFRVKIRAHDEKRISSVSIIVALQTQSSDLSRELSSVSTSAFGVRAFYERFASLGVCDVLILRLFGVDTCIQNVKNFIFVPQKDVHPLGSRLCFVYHHVSFL